MSNVNGVDFSLLASALLIQYEKSTYKTAARATGRILQFTDAVQKILRRSAQRSLFSRGDRWLFERKISHRASLSEPTNEVRFRKPSDGMGLAYTPATDLQKDGAV